MLAFGDEREKRSLITFRARKLDSPEAEFLLGESRRFQADIERRDRREKRGSPPMPAGFPIGRGNTLSDGEKNVQRM